jgi:murein DD-endopeptidase MepM/ murein hydrolase activator NlpD
MMAKRRWVLVVTDGAGSHLGRIKISNHALMAAAGLCALMLLMVLVLTGLGISARRDAKQAAPLARQTLSLKLSIDAMAARRNKLEAVLLENSRALALLQRKSHVHEGAALADVLRGPEPEPAAAAPASPPDAHAHADFAQSTLEGIPQALGHADALIAESYELEGALGDLLEYWRDAEQRLLYTPSIRPCRSPYTTSSYGVRIDPVFHYWVMHKGLDMGGFIGMIVYAPADGVVIWTGTRGGYGQVVVIDHGRGLQTHYAHLSDYMVTRGQNVRRGTPIARMGSTGKSTGPHLHYEVRQDGVPMDPRQFILD